MSARWRNLLIAAVAVLLASLFVIWFLRTHERVSEQVPVPSYGEARYNPLYALRQTLRIDGVQAESRRRLDLPAMRLQPGDSVLLLEDPRQLAPAEARQLLDWVGHGGHLLLRVPAADEDGDAPGPLLTGLGIELSSAPARCQRWQVRGDGEHSEFCNGPRFTLGAAADPERQWPGDQAGAGLGYARLRHGKGRVDVLADMDFLLNRGDELDGERAFPGITLPASGGGLRDIAHRDLARLVLAPNYGKGTIHLVYSAKLPSLWQTLLTRGWPVWLPLLLALLSWLWTRMQRFGPLLPSPREERRSLLEHVRASGEHLFRYGKSPLLYDAVRRAFLARLRRRAPVAAALSGAAQAHAIAEHLQRPLAQVQQALQAPASNDASGLRDRIRLLIQMRNQL
ncbi:MAG: DUF4350 domain-containing protein [Stenotrophomonas sp.]